MKIERVQRWVMSSLLLLVGGMLSVGMLLAALRVISPDRGGAQVGMVVMATVVAILTILGTRLLNARSLLTPWLLCGLLPALVGGFLLAVQ